MSILTTPDLDGVAVESESYTLITTIRLTNGATISKSIMKMGDKHYAESHTYTDSAGVKWDLTKNPDIRLQLSERNLLFEVQPQ